MDSPFVVVPVILATLAALFAGLVFSVRKLQANAEGPPDPDLYPRAPEAGLPRHDHATVEVLKQFFDGKACAICKLPIPPVQRTGLKPGVLDSRTREIRSWDEIPNGSAASALEGHEPVCSDCRIAEAFRQRFPDRPVDRDPSLRDAHPL